MWLALWEAFWLLGLAHVDKYVKFAKFNLNYNNVTSRQGL
jgi:hypothetical protein